MKGSGLTPLDSRKYGLRCYMKLLWLSTSEAHTNNQAYNMNGQYEYMQGTTQANEWYGNMNNAMHNIKRERVERQVDQTQRPRYVTRFEHLALHPRLHHRVGFPIHYNVHQGLPLREPSPRRISNPLCSHRGNLHRGGFVTTQGVPNSSLKHRLTTEG